MKELAENRKDARPQPGDQDQRYSGIAAHPLARRWLQRKLRDEQRAAIEAGPGEEREQRKAEVERLRAQLAPEGGSHAS